MMPNVSGALRGWTEPLTVMVVSRTVVDHRPVETATTAILRGSLRPMPAQEVARKPEEQRSWRWWRLLTTAGAALLKIDDALVVDGHNYRVQSVQRWDRCGYRRYDLLQDYQGELPPPEEVS